MIDLLKFKAFRATDDEVASLKFAEGHYNVLVNFGVPKVTSANTDWVYNPYVYVVIVESAEDGEVLGGVRVHVADGIQPLPFEQAISQVDKKVFDLVAAALPGGAAEICGLWNAKSIEGYGVGAVFLMRASIAMVNQLNINTVFALCARHTKKRSTEKGFVIETSIGNSGDFYYPKLDLVATAIVIKDPYDLSSASPNEREKIFDLRNNPIQKTKEIGPKGHFEIEYDLLLKLK